MSTPTFGFILKSLLKNFLKKPQKGWMSWFGENIKEESAQLIVVYSSIFLLAFPTFFLFIFLMVRWVFILHFSHWEVFVFILLIFIFIVKLPFKLKSYIQKVKNNLLLKYPELFKTWIVEEQKILQKKLPKGKPLRKIKRL